MALAVGQRGTLLYASREIPFLEYAFNYWTIHVRLAEDEIDEKMANDILELCDVKLSHFFW